MVFLEKPQRGRENTPAVGTVFNEAPLGRGEASSFALSFFVFLCVCVARAHPLPPPSTYPLDELREFGEGERGARVAGAVRPAAEAHPQMHEIPVWLEYGRKGPYVRYCGDHAQFGHEDLNPDKLGAIEVGDPQRMMDWAMLQQSDMLHQVALAYYDRHAPKDSPLRKKITAAYEQAKQGGKYQSVLRFDGQRLPLPAMASEKEYFAELMESYFLVNDHYPFIRCELKDQDPSGYAVIAGLWHGNPLR